MIELVSFITGVIIIAILVWRFINRKVVIDIEWVKLKKLTDAELVKLFDDYLDNKPLTGETRRLHQFLAFKWYEEKRLNDD